MDDREKEGPRVSSQGLRVLSVFVNGDAQELSGADVHRQTGLPSGTLYPILVRFERAGWLQSRWEKADPERMGRPRKRFYRITRSGARAFSGLVSDVFPGGKSWAFGK